MATSPPFAQLKPSSSDLYLPNKQGVKPHIKKVEAIVKIATPKTVKQVHSLIGMINYYKDHMPHHSKLLRPLTQFKWTDDCQHSFDSI
jgi:hypothetical protein